MHIQAVKPTHPRHAPLLTIRDIAVLAVVSGLALGYLACLWHQAAQKSSKGSVVLCQSKP